MTGFRYARGFANPGGGAMKGVKWLAIAAAVVGVAVAVGAARTRRPSCEAGECLAPVAPLASPLPAPPGAVGAGRSF